jgi:hypothetical protein
VLQSSCGVLMFSSTGVLLLYELTPAGTPGRAVWSSHIAPANSSTTLSPTTNSTNSANSTNSTNSTITASSANRTANSTTNSTSTNATAAASSAAAAIAAASALPVGTSPAYALKLSYDGLLLSYIPGQPPIDLWDNGVSFPPSAPFQLDIACNASKPSLVEKDTYGNVVWDSGATDIVAGSALALMQSAAGTEPLGSFVRVAVQLTPADSLKAGQAKDSVSSSSVITASQLTGGSSTSVSGAAAATADASSGSSSGGSMSDAVDQSQAMAAAAGKAIMWPSSNGDSSSNGRRSTWSQSLVFLDNGQLKAGFDLALGGALAFLSRAAEPGLNLINAHDPGRLVQQSYFGSPDNSSWQQYGQQIKWRYNPVQAGSSGQQLGALLDHNLNYSSQCFSSRSLPRHWATDELLPEVQMWQTICLRGGLVDMSFQMKYTGALGPGHCCWLGGADAWPAGLLARTPQVLVGGLRCELRLSGWPACLLAVLLASQAPCPGHGLCSCCKACATPSPLLPHPYGHTSCAGTHLPSTPRSPPPTTPQAPSGTTRQGRRCQRCTSTAASPHWWPTQAASPGQATRPTPAPRRPTTPALCHSTGTPQSAGWPT